MILNLWAYHCTEHRPGVTHWHCVASVNGEQLFVTGKTRGEVWKTAWELIAQEFIGMTTEANA